VFVPVAIDFVCGLFSRYRPPEALWPRESVV
jgi:hypothetical protein